MGGDHSQKLLPWRGTYSSPGRSKPPAHREITTVTDDTTPLRAADQQKMLTYGGVGHFWKAGAGHFSKAPKGSVALLNFGCIAGRGHFNK